MSKFRLPEALLFGVALTVSCPNPDRQGQVSAPVAAQQEPGRSNDGQPAEAEIRRECARIGAEQREAMAKLFFHPDVVATMSAEGNFDSFRGLAFAAGDHGRMAEEGCLASKGLKPAR